MSIRLFIIVKIIKNYEQKPSIGPQNNVCAVSFGVPSLWDCLLAPQSAPLKELHLHPYAKQFIGFPADSGHHFPQLSGLPTNGLAHSVFA